MFLPGVGTAAAAMAILSKSARNPAVAYPTCARRMFSMQLMVETSAEGGFQGTKTRLFEPNARSCGSHGIKRRALTSWVGTQSLIKKVYLRASHKMPTFTLCTVLPFLNTSTLASCTYGNTFTAAINKDNFTGCNFTQSVLARPEHNY